jgi:HSP20 family protein
MANALDRWFDNRTLSPIRDITAFEDSFDRLFNEFVNLRRTGGAQEIAFAPSCEVLEEGNNYVMKFDLPGVPKNQVSVEFADDQLTIKAERKEEKKNESAKKYLSEMYYGSYSRTFTLPGPVDEKKVDAKYENGVLTVTVPKMESHKAKQIPIH